MTAHPFTLDVARALGGPDWLVARRVAAAERLAALDPPTTEEEIWRYSRIDEFDLGAWRPLGRVESFRLAVGVAQSGVADPAARTVGANGVTVKVELDEGLAAKGVVVGDLAETDGARTWLGRVSAESSDWFTDLHDAFLVGGAFVHVPRGVVVDRPIVVIDVLEGPVGLAAFPHALIVVEEEAEATVVVHRSSSADTVALSSAVVEVVVGDGANVNVLGVQDHGPRVWEVALQRAHVGRDAHLTSAAVALGGEYARLRSESLVSGDAGQSDMLAVYFADGNQMLDFRTLQDHEAPRSRSDLLFKGAVEHEAHSVYSGLVRLRKSAQKSDAHQTNRTLKLSPGSHAESQPFLEILANDVVCTHASAVGPVDDEQLLYLGSRGVPPEVAERLIVSGFFEDVFERLPVRSLADPLREAVAEKFARRDAALAGEVPARA